MSLLFNKHPLVINPQLAEKIGLNEAIVLQQIHYWLEKDGIGKDYNGKHWIYSSYENWIKQFPFWSEATIKRTISNLKKEGLIDVEQLNKTSHDRTNYYTICYSRLAQHEQYDKVNMTPSTISKCNDLSETTTKTTTEIKTLVELKPDPAPTPAKTCQKTEQAKTILETLNLRTGKTFRPVDSNLGLIKARLAEGATHEDLISVIDRKCQEWLNDPKMMQFLRPKTLFNASNFNNYFGDLNAPLPEKLNATNQKEQADWDTVGWIERDESFF